MDKLSEKLADRVSRIQESISQLRYRVKVFFFGERAQGEKIKEPTFTSSIPETRPDEFEWYAEFRVGSLQGVNQRAYLG